jgi:hypothetical protein
MGPRQVRVGRSARALLALALVVTLAACGGGDDGGAGGEAETPATTSSTAPAVAPDDDLRLNQIQVIGTHNSFHRAPPSDELEQLAALDAQAAAERAYSHAPIGEQLAEQRIRQLELDVFVDSQGGRYADPALRADDAEPMPAVMDEPGIKVLHEQDVDYHSVCPALRQCLEEVAAWSDANPAHVPVAIHVQLKDGPLIFDVADQATPELWTAEQLDALDAEIRDVFDEGELITPDEVRAGAATLEEAVLADGWPTLGESRGKVMFLMINSGQYRDTYRDGHPVLEGRVLFTNAEPGQPDAAYVGVDDPVVDGARIAELVELGYLVRTRADANGVEAQATDTTRLDAALASGAHWIATDYPGPDGARAQYGTDFVAQLPGFVPARCNPVTAPDDCDDAAVEPGT